MGTSQLLHYYLRLLKCWMECNWHFLSWNTNSTYDTGYWYTLSPLDKNKCVIGNISHHRERKKQKETQERSGEQREDNKKRHVVTVLVPITFDSESLSCLSKKKRQINIVIHNFRLNSPCFYCLHVLFWAIQSAVTVTNASQSIVGEISELTSGMFFFPSLPLFFPPKWTGSEAMEQNT